MSELINNAKIKRLQWEKDLNFSFAVYIFPYVLNNSLVGEYINVALFHEPQLVQGS